MHSTFTDFNSPFNFGTSAKPSVLSPEELDNMGYKRTNNIFINIPTMDGSLMKKRFAPESVRKIWIALGQDIENIKFSCCVLIPKRGCRIKFKLHNPIHLDSISTNQFLIWENIPEDNPHGLDMIDMKIFRARIHKYYN